MAFNAHEQELITGLATVLLVHTGKPPASAVETAEDFLKLLKSKGLPLPTAIPFTPLLLEIHPKEV